MSFDRHRLIHSSDFGPSRSFFSGHTSPVFCKFNSAFPNVNAIGVLLVGLGWLIMYIHVSWSWRHLGIIGHMFPTGFAILGLYIGYSRIFDFHHHWNDVLVGGIVGLLVAFVSFKFILNWHHYSPRFLPYTVSRIRERPISAINAPNSMHRISISRNNAHDISDQNDLEQGHYF